jgi:uncharacterized protein with NAD-binding domain and iron-sulfur cluster
MAKTKIAILGGGMAGLSAAYQLTKTQALRDQYDVTVYTLGWRLGGKAASGRDALGRNLEHGLHVWFGCYENAFQMLQELYTSDAPGGQLQTWQDAVKPQTYTPVGVLNDDGTWSCWPLTWPTNSGKPGDGTLLPTLGQMLETLLGWLSGGVRNAEPAWAEALAAAGPPPQAATHAPILPTDARPSSALDAAQQHLRALGSELSGQSDQNLDHLVALVGWARNAMASAAPRPLAAAASPLDLRMWGEILDIFFATVNGIVEDLIKPDLPFEALDGSDFRAWLISHGANPAIVNTSTVVRVVYDTLFQYSDGDVTRPSYAAGTGLGVVMRLVGTYKGSMMWDIQAGMGEVLVAPLYNHLKAAGVTFEFFSKVTGLEASADGSLVQTITMNRQTEVLNGHYAPTFDLNGLTVWPAEPFWDQLLNGAAMQAAGVNFESYWCGWPPVQPPVMLQVGTDFDIAILAISLGAYKPLNNQDVSFCDSLIKASPRFADYVQNVGVVPTQSVQLWCDPTTAALGWTSGKAATVSGPEYLNIWADMSQVLAFEPWPAPAPQSLHYLTGTCMTTLYREPSANTGVPQQASDEIRTQAIAWLNQSSYALWPNADAGGAFDWSVLHVEQAAAGEARFDQQFWRANIDPTECCTLSAAGTTQYRLHPEETGFSNLFLAGEGTRHGFNTTAIEGAIMSGAAAARVISGQPVTIVGYDFLQRRPSQGAGT